VSTQAIAKLPLVGVMLARVRDDGPPMLFENFDSAFLAYRAGFPNSAL